VTPNLTRRQFLAGATVAGGAVLITRSQPTAGGAVLGAEGASPRAQAIRPLLGGTWITPSEIDKWGTLGVGVEYDGSPAIVTNRHVVDDGSGEDSSAVVGREVYQPSEETDAIGTVAAASTIGGRGSSDWAVIGVDSADWGTATLGLGEIGAAVSPSAGDRVVLDGAYSGLLGGEVSRVGVDANFRGELYSGLIEYRVDEDRETDGNSGGIVATIDDSGVVHPVGLHTFRVDEYRFAIQWSDLPDAVDVTATGRTPAPPAVAGVIEGVIYGRAASGEVFARVRNLGGAVASETVRLGDPSTGEVLDSINVEIGALDHRDLVLDPRGRDRVELRAGRTSVVSDLPA